jgi:hypothetical protein
VLKQRIGSRCTSREAVLFGLAMVACDSYIMFGVAINRTKSQRTRRAKVPPNGRSGRGRRKVLPSADGPDALVPLWSRRGAKMMMGGAPDCDDSWEDLDLPGPCP